MSIQASSERKMMAIGYKACALLGPLHLAYILSETAKLLGIDEAELLSKDEIAALNGKANPEGLII